jgi:hypothetical protein
MVDSGNGDGIVAQTYAVFTSADVWVHVAFVYNNGAGQLYINGIADGVLGTQEFNCVGGSIKKTGLGCILSGANNATPTNYYTGRIAGFQIATYSAANLAKALTFQDLANPLFYVPLAEGAGNSAYEVSGDKRHGTITGATLSTFWGTKQDYFHYNLLNRFKSMVNFPEANFYTFPATAAITGQLTIPCWYMPITNGVNRRIVSKDDASKNRCFALQVTTANRINFFSGMPAKQSALRRLPKFYSP